MEHNVSTTGLFFTKEVEVTLRAHNIPLIVHVEHRRTPAYTYMETLSDVGAVVVDQIPLSFMSR